MKCYIQIGMHKTGTTSIQSDLSKLVSDEFHYLKLDGPNHSIVLRTLFGSELYGHPALRRDGYASADAVQAYREKWLAAFDSQVAAVEKNLVISAEDLSLEVSREI